VPLSQILGTSGELETDQNVYFGLNLHFSREQFHPSHTLHTLMAVPNGKTPKIESTTSSLITDYKGFHFAASQIEFNLLAPAAGMQIPKFLALWLLRNGNSNISLCGKQKKVTATYIVQQL
jgi:hypothetical protein